MRVRTRPPGSVGMRQRYAVAAVGRGQTGLPLAHVHGRASRHRRQAAQAQPSTSPTSSDGRRLAPRPQQDRTDLQAKLAEVAAGIGAHLDPISHKLTHAESQLLVQLADAEHIRLEALERCAQLTQRLYAGGGVRGTDLSDPDHGVAVGPEPDFVAGAVTERRRLQQQLVVQQTAVTAAAGHVYRLHHALEVLLSSDKATHVVSMVDAPPYVALLQGTGRVRGGDQAGADEHAGSGHGGGIRDQEWLQGDGASEALRKAAGRSPAGAGPSNAPEAAALDAASADEQHSGSDGSGVSSSALVEEMQEQRRELVAAGAWLRQQAAGLSRELMRLAARQQGQQQQQEQPPPPPPAPVTVASEAAPVAAGGADAGPVSEQLMLLQARLSEAEGERASLSAQLAAANEQLNEANERLVEASNLQMEHDKACQDIYRLRSRLQRLQNAGSAASEASQEAVLEAKRQRQWLMREHRLELGRLHEDNAALSDQLAALRLRLVEDDEALSRMRSGDSSSGGGGDGAAVAAMQLQKAKQAAAVAAAAAALDQAQATQTALAGELQEALREKAGMGAELSTLEEQLQQAAVAQAEAAAAAAAGYAERSQLRSQLAELQGHAQEQQQQLERLAAAAGPAASGTQAAQLAAARVDADAAVAAAAALQQQLSVAHSEQRALRGQLAAARGQVADLTRQLEQARAAAEQRIAQLAAQVADLQRWYGKQVAAAAALRQRLQPDAAGYVAVNRYWVPADLLFEFYKCWARREAAMSEAQGFLALQVAQEGAPAGAAAEASDGSGGVSVRVRGMWATADEWQAWCNGPAGRRMQDLPEGVKQYVPDKGQGGALEDFVPFVQ